jgi:hypothetical protein
VAQQNKNEWKKVTTFHFGLMSKGQFWNIILYKKFLQKLGGKKKKLSYKKNLPKISSNYWNYQLRRIRRLLRATNFF